MQLNFVFDATTAMNVFLLGCCCSTTTRRCTHCEGENCLEVLVMTLRRELLARRLQDGVLGLSLVALLTDI